MGMYKHANTNNQCQYATYITCKTDSSQSLDPQENSQISDTSTKAVRHLSIVPLDLCLSVHA